MNEEAKKLKVVTSVLQIFRLFVTTCPNQLEQKDFS